jgi:aminoglycoside phosphotransferase (APT) family kinase protein
VQKMHADELLTDVPLVQRLLAAQFPEWAALPIERVPSSGTDNALYRLGDDMVVRLPRIGWAAKDVETDARWLPVLAPLLPVELPELLAHGKPTESYPWDWGVYKWLEGENPVVGSLVSPEVLARDISRFVSALRELDVPGAPPGSRGAPLATRDAETRTAIAELDGTVDTDSVTAVWDGALQVPPWPGPPIWTHGDLLRGNLLLRDGRLTGVIDWSGAGVGDPAADLIAAWSVLPADARETLREELSVDDAMWLRGRGLALSVALLQVPYYRETNPELAGNGLHIIEQVLAEPNIRS